MRKEFETWAANEMFDMSCDPFAPIGVYSCWKTDAAWEGWKDYNDAADYNENPYNSEERCYEYWSFGWRGAREYGYIWQRDNE